MLTAWSCLVPVCADLYAFAVPENAAVGTTVGRIMAEDGDIGINAKMSYSLEDGSEESATFIIRTDPVTQEGVVLLAKVHKHVCLSSAFDFISICFLVRCFKGGCKAGKRTWAGKEAIRV